MWAEVLLVGLVGGIIHLDRTAFLQSMISRPLVAAPLIGLLLGQGLTGLYVGLVVEFLWSSQRPLGGALPPNETLGSIIGTAGVILAQTDPVPPPAPLVALGLILTPPLAHLAASLEGIWRLPNLWLLRQAEKAAGAGHPEMLHRLNLVGLGLALILGFLVIVMTLPVTILFLKLSYATLPIPAVKALGWMYRVLPFISLAAALVSLEVPRRTRIFALFFALTLIWLGLTGG